MCRICYCGECIFEAIQERIFYVKTLLRSVINDHILSLIGGGSRNRPNPIRLFYFQYGR